VGELTARTVRESDYQTEKDVAHGLPVDSRSMEPVREQGS